MIDCSDWFVQEDDQHHIYRNGRGINDEGLMKIIDDYPDAQYLFLRDNYITNIDCLSRLQCLEYLDVSLNQIGRITSLPSSIREIVLSQNPITGSEILFNPDISVRFDKCLKSGCDAIPKCGWMKSDETACINHIQPGMTQRICSECPKKSGYGEMFGLAERCFSHKLSHHHKVNVSCEVDGCKNQPEYMKLRNRIPKRCEIHKDPADKKFQKNICPSCNLEFYSSGGRCNACRDSSKPENIIKKLLVDNLFEFIHDKPISNKCVYRPDFILDGARCKIIVEVDEKQHKKYEAETSRMDCIADQFSCPLVFVRYNPCSYKNQLGKQGRTSQDKRHKVLLTLLNYLIKNTQIRHKLVVYYLYYDGFNGKYDDVENLEVIEN